MIKDKPAIAFVYTLVYTFRESLDNFSTDLFSEGREQPPLQEREELFGSNKPAKIDVKK
jgi:hypothetical protein